MFHTLLNLKSAGKPVRFVKSCYVYVTYLDSWRVCVRGSSENVSVIETDCICVSKRMRM